MGKLMEDNRCSVRCCLCRHILVLSPTPVIMIALLSRSERGQLHKENVCPIVKQIGTGQRGFSASTITVYNNPYVTVAYFGVVYSDPLHRHDCPKVPYHIIPIKTRSLHGTNIPEQEILKPQVEVTQYEEQKNS